MGLRILHIFSDEKFIDKHIIKYKDSSFTNFFIYLKDKNSYAGDNQLVRHVVPNSAEYFALVNEADDFNFVILYYLNSDKLKFLNDMKGDKAKVIWSFYGIELYSLARFKYRMLTHETQVLSGFKKGFINLGILKDFFRSAYGMLTGKETYHRRLLRLLSKIDYFLWYNRFEYDYLNTELQNRLPKFLLATLNNKLEDVKPVLPKNESVVLGNSASPYNNHLNALLIFEKSNFQGKIYIPFAYAGTPKYVDSLKKRIKDFAVEIRLLERFVPYESYINELNGHSAAIFPSSRQLGLGNIFIAVRCGLKIYLSSMNPTYNWLLEEGFRIYSIENHLEQDINTRRLRLDEQSIKTNNDCYDRFLDSKNDQLFFEKLIKISSSPAI